MRKMAATLTLILFVSCAAAYASDAPIVIDRICPVKRDTQKTFNISTPLTLSDCYQLALKQSEIIAIDEGLIRQAEARFLQALSIMMPYFSYQSKEIGRASCRERV